MDNTTRRSFIVKATAFVGALAMTKATLGASADTDLISRMTWFNEPASSKRVGEKLIVRSRPKTDFWRKTFYGYITDNGHFLHLQADGDFIFEARVNGGYAALYDQAGLMVRVNAENWKSAALNSSMGSVTPAWCSPASSPIGPPCRT